MGKQNLPAVRRKTVFITGGAGFIGSYLSEKLVARGDRVFVLDNLSTGRAENIRHLRSSKNFTFVKGDVLNERLTRKMAAQADEVYHLAAAVGVRTIMEKPLESLILNMRGTEIVLKASESRKIPVLLTSSSEIYGKNTKLPFREEDDRVYGSVYNYRWGYAFSKGIDEFLGLAYFREKGVPVRVARLFNVIGPRQTSEYGMVVPRFVQQALRGKPLTIYGDGAQTRCFGDVEDVTDALIKVMAHTKSKGEVYNLGSDEEVSIKSLAKKVIELTGSRSKILHIPYTKAYKSGFEDMARRRPALLKVKKLIGYDPKYSLEGSIRKIIEYERQQKG